MERATGKCELELRNERGGDTLVTKVQNHENHVSEESREEKDVEKPKSYNKDRNLLHPNKQDRRRYSCNSHQPN